MCANSRGSALMVIHRSWSRLEAFLAAALERLVLGRRLSLVLEDRERRACPGAVCTYPISASNRYRGSRGSIG